MQEMVLLQLLLLLQFLLLQRVSSKQGVWGEGLRRLYVQLKAPSTRLQRHSLKS